MIIIDEFIWKTDHYAYHITNTDAMRHICNEGLKPLCGERSKSVNDDIKGIFFFENLYMINDWIDALYKNKNIYELELLRFNLKNRKWLMRNIDEYYLTNKVQPNKIEYLRLCDKEQNNYLPLDTDKEAVIEWNKLSNYKSLKKV